MVEGCPSQKAWVRAQPFFMRWIALPRRCQMLEMQQCRCLPAEPSVFPSPGPAENRELLPFAAITDALPEFRWWVLHTRPRAKKTLVRRPF